MLTVAAVVLLLVVAAVGLLGVKRAADTASIASECREAVRRLSDPNLGTAERESLVARARECRDDLAAAGIQFDPIDALVRVAETTMGAIDRQWGDFRSVDYSDVVQRTNKRNDIGRNLDLLGRQLREIAVNAESEEQRAKARRIIERAILDSLNRASMYAAGSSGTARYFGSLEPNWDEKVRDEVTHGAFAFGLRAATESGWRSPNDRGEPDRYSPNWDPWFAAADRFGDRWTLASLWRVGELARITAPEFTMLGVQYAGQRGEVERAYRETLDTPYSLVKPPRALTASDISRITGGIVSGRLFTLGA